MPPLRQNRRPKYLDYYVPVQEHAALSDDGVVSEGELIIQYEGEMTVVAPSQVQFVNLPPV